ncbi:DUF6119 family protein [Amycolatopsis sp. NPDC049868]|uniref:DUF6119 family protein n=1 Tax=Amycolatopsis sp. NPDC049868 TaxID=3363934 RepID=UPI00379285B7
MDNTDEVLDSVAQATATRRMSVYRLLPAGPVNELLAPKVVEDEEGTFTIERVVVGRVPGTLVYGETETAEVEWAETVERLTGVDVEFTTTTASAALVLPVDGVNYAVAFGHGRHYLRDGKIDAQFGLDIAVRLLDPDEIRRITRWALSAKARVDQNNVPGGQQLWAFGLREHAELIRNLTGRVRVEVMPQIAHVKRRGHYRNFRLSLTCSNAVQVPLGIEGDSLIADLRELTRVIDQVAPHDQLTPLQWVRRMPADHPLIEVLDSATADLLAEPDSASGEVGIAYPARYYDGPDVQRYQGFIGEATIDTEDLTIEHVQAGVRAHGPDEYLRVLRTGRIDGLDEAGRSLGGDVSALNWLAAEIIDPQCRYILLDGDWYELGDQYLDHVDRVVTEAFSRAPSWTLPRWRDAKPEVKPDGTERYVEGNYNLHVAKQDPRFLCLDKKLVTSRAHPHGIEACDLLGPANELVHVKKFSSKTGSSVLSHLFAQGLVAVETLLTHAKTWEEFREKVRAQDPARADALGVRPAALVYAIHRSDKPLNPGTLFTFARSALVSASIALNLYGIPLQICVIR